MRPAGATTTVATAVGDAAANPSSEGASRPHFFGGVATVVAALLHLTRPTVAFFGEKDAQQLAVVTALARDLHFGTTIVGVPTVREADGVAASSRNVYLTAAGRAAAPALYRSLVAARDAWAEAGETAASALRAAVRRGVDAGTAASGGRVLYVSVADRWSMAEVDGAVRSAADVRATAPGGEVVVCVAVQLGAARLIDNIVLR